MKRFVVPLLGIALLVACDAMPRESRPEVDEMLPSEEFAVPGPVLWEIATREMGSLGFELDASDSDAGSLSFESHWAVRLGPLRYQGFRRKMVGQILEVPSRPGRFVIRATTWVQTNADMKDPLDPGRAIWQDSDPDNAVTEEFFFRIRRHF